VTTVLRKLFIFWKIDVQYGVVGVTANQARTRARATIASETAPMGVSAAAGISVIPNTTAHPTTTIGVSVNQT